MPVDTNSNVSVSGCQKTILEAPSTNKFKNNTELAEYISTPFDDRLKKSPLSKNSVTSSIFVKAMMSAERWWNEGTRTYSKNASYSELPSQYQPQSATPSFATLLMRIDKTGGNIIKTSHPSTDILEKYVKKDYALIPVHPDFFKNKNEDYNTAILDKKPEGQTEVIPSASSRSLLVDASGSQLHSQKVHCPRKISRFNRTFGPRTMQHCVAVSALVEKVKCEKFAFLPETIGIAIPKTKNKKGWAAVIREMTPRPPVKEERLLIPGFSLYADNPVENDGKPLLAYLAENSTKSPKKFLQEDLVFPIIDCWVAAFKQQGVILESHAQNTLIEVDENLKISRIVTRDLDNYVDNNLRKENKLPLFEAIQEEQIVAEETLEHPKGSPHSLIYDSSVGHHFLDYIAECAKKQFQVDPEELQKAAQEHFEKVFPDFDQYFPQTRYYYNSTPLKGKPNSFALVDTKEKPHWRPQTKKSVK